jgi:hypothetical protein
MEGRGDKIAGPFKGRAAVHRLERGRPELEEVDPGWAQQVTDCSWFTQLDLLGRQGTGKFMFLAIVLFFLKTSIQIFIAC